VSTRVKTYGPLVVVTSATFNNLQDTTFITRASGPANQTPLVGLEGDSDAVKGLFRTFDCFGLNLAPGVAIDHSDWRDRHLTIHLAHHPTQNIWPGSAGDNKTPWSETTLDFYSGAGGITRDGGAVGLGVTIDAGTGWLMLHNPDGYVTGWARGTNQLKRRS
jgi:hypothetical protein